MIEDLCQIAARMNDAKDHRTISARTVEDQIRTMAERTQPTLNVFALSPNKRHSGGNCSRLLTGLLRVGADGMVDGGLAA